MASTGSKREAEMAGKIPEIIPTNMDKPVPIAIFEKLRINSKSSKLVSNIANNHTIKSPIIPPIMHKITDSKRN